MFQTAHFGPLDHRRAGARILYRVRVRLVDQWKLASFDFAERDLLFAAVCVVDSCLSLLWPVR